MDINNGVCFAWFYSQADVTSYTYPITFSNVFTAVCHNRTGSTSTQAAAYVWVTRIVGVVTSLNLSSLTAYSYPQRGYLIIGTI